MHYTQVSERNNLQNGDGIRKRAITVAPHDYVRNRMLKTLNEVTTEITDKTNFAPSTIRCTRINRERRRCQFPVKLHANRNNLTTTIQLMMMKL